MKLSAYNNENRRETNMNFQINATNTNSITQNLFSYQEPEKENKSEKTTHEKRTQKRAERENR